MINFDNVIKEETKQRNPNWQQITDHPYRILIIRGSGSGKTNSLFKLISRQPDIDKMYLFTKDPYKEKYQFNKRESTDSKPDKKRKILIVFEGMIADMLSNKKRNSIATELFIRGRQLNISLVFITQSYLKVPKNVRIDTTHFFIMNIPNKTEL